MRLTAYQVTQLLGLLEEVVKRDDHPAAALTIWLRDRQDEAIHMSRAKLVERLNAEGYTRCIVLPTGELAGIQPMLYTTGLFVGLTEVGWRTRFCYERKADAVASLDAWDGRGDPPGPWIKEKPSDRLGPGATE